MSKCFRFPYLFLLLMIVSCSSARTIQTAQVSTSPIVENVTYPTLTPSPSRPSSTLTIAKATNVNNPCSGFDVYSVSSPENVRYQNGLLAEIGTRDKCNINGTAITFSPDGSLLALANYDGVRVYSVQTGELVHYFASKESELLIWSGDTVNSKGEFVPLTTIRGGVVSVAFSPNGELLASITVTGEVKLWDLHSAAVVNTFSPQTSSPVLFEPWNSGLAFNDNGSLLIAWIMNVENQPIRIWNVATGELIAAIPGELINAATISPDGRHFVIGGQDWKMYDIYSQKFISGSLEREGVGYLAFDDNGQRLYTTNWFTGEVSAWDPSTGEKLLSFGDCDSTCTAEGPMNAFEKFNLTSDGSRLVFIDFFPDYKVYLWNTQTGVLLESFEADRFINAVAISPNGTEIAALYQSIDEQYMTIYFWHALPK